MATKQKVDPTPVGQVTICLGIRQVNSADYILVEAHIQDGKLISCTESVPMAIHLALYNQKRRAAETWLPK